MTRFLLAGAAAAAFVVPAFAQPAPPPPPGVAQGTNPVPTVPRVRVETRVERMPMMMPETRAEVVAHVREMFAKLDINRDGFVTRDEAEAAHKMMGGEMHRGMDRPMADGAMPPLPPMPPMDRKAMFDRLDTNHDGMISRQEFDAHAQIREERRVVMHGGPDGKPDMAGMGRMHAMAMRMHSRIFDMADANHDGKVSLQEMTDAALRHFDMADANHDGRITPEERMQMHQRMKEMKRPA